mmetsp:Transcript_63067/g.195260  ORF Transcript_63067/g.195260 Transcript_63067/m.195260 type:complete len:478 (+) Transcript_63067:33-1466(+)|eukprot:CAMPEP_0204588172 /NCGR_PEP_ID=MMETSP0661-20131031/48462_1 /ASSEMBLY_ACC=CAM_ASM_000606 /TAXON_ID=109239 /ORGANISM="Alexandrium margalefi, Strain AMGDE01CS-322" /LENGTH=477 /DNA_ID=CAMNT_0051597971 /DNA_START=33 /DNA_END=1466 /DNA_ORIENTATION=-
MEGMLDDLFDNADPWGSSFWSSLIALRREIHMYPEPGFKEERTQKRIREILTSTAGIPESQIKASAITGLVIDIVGMAAPRPNPSVKCVALRADIDALTMTEANSTLPYKSRNVGVAHMCGHDGHLTSLVGAAILLQRRASKIPANMTVRLLFQPAEESTPPGTGGFDYAKTGGGGAMPMIMEGCLENVDEVYGWHNWPAWPLGELRVAVGPVMAHTMTFEVVITGRGGHGSQPHATVDPIVCGAAVVSALQTIVSRSLPSYKNAVVSVCQFHAGERSNVIPDEARLSGTIRDADAEAAATIARRLPELVKGICKGFGCSADVEMQDGFPPLVNHAGPTEAVERCARRLEAPLGLRVTSEGLPMMGGEDFAFYVKQLPGCYFFLGTKEILTRGLAAYDGTPSAVTRTNCICHGTAFDFNDNALVYAINMMVKIIEDRFGVELYTQNEVLRAPMASDPPSVVEEDEEGVPPKKLLRQG